MFYIKLDSDMSLIITVREPIYRGDNLSQKLRFLIPQTVGEIDVDASVVYLNYIRPDGVADIVELDRLEEKYSEYLQYTFPISCKVTKFPGELCTWLHIFSGSLSNPKNAKSGECFLRIQDAKNMDDYLCDHQITAIYQLGKRVDEDIEHIETLIAAKADNIIFHAEDHTIQLTSDGEPIGDRIVVSTSGGAGIIDMRITTDGELLVFFDDGTIRNLGKVVGDDGKVYVPHVDSHKILTFTIEDQAGEIPDPVDLNPSDEWSDIDGGGPTDYIWEDIETRNRH